MKQAIARGQRGNGAMQLRSPAREHAVYGQGAARRETSLLLVLLYLRRVVAAQERPLLRAFTTSCSARSAMCGLWSDLEPGTPDQGSATAGPAAKTAWR